MKQRRYSVDDCDYEDYKSNGGTLTRAGFYNALLGPRPNVKMQYADAKHAGRLDSRIRDKLKEQ